MQLRHIMERFTAERATRSGRFKEYSFNRRTNGVATNLAHTRLVPTGQRVLPWCVEHSGSRWPCCAGNARLEARQSSGVAKCTSA
jgi:hypothetical protein